MEDIKIDEQLDVSLLEFEVVTRIPKEQLIHVICGFYQSIGYNLVNLRLQNLRDEENYEYVSYKPDFEADYGYLVNGISISTYKTENKRRFDRIKLEFDSLTSQKTKIKADFEVSFFPMWFFLYCLIVILVPVYLVSYDTHGLTSKYIAGAVAFLLALPGVIIILLFRIPQLGKLKKHPDFMRYKNEFEEHIRQKEREMFSEGY